MSGCHRRTGADRQRAVSCHRDQPGAVAAPSPEIADADAARHLENLRTALHGQDPSVFAQVDRPAGFWPRLLVGGGPQRLVTVTPPLNDQDTAVYRWGRWGARITPVTMPETAAAAILAAMDAPA